MSGGKFEFDDGGFYIGEWQDGEASGYGVCTGPGNIGKFEGYWENGVEVSGIYTWPNNTQYRGQWKEGQRQGYGKEVFSRLEYNGEWTSGLKHGSGVVRTSTSKRPCFEGTWRNGLQDGHGVEIYNEGGFYSGQWKEGFRHGYGIRGWADIDRLQDGAVSVRQLLQQQGSPRDSSTPTISGSSADLEDRSSVPAPTAQLNYNSTLDLERVTGNLHGKGMAPSPRPRVSVFQMVMNNFKRGDDTTNIHQHKREFYKGVWVKDTRHGPGICFYDDGSKYIGQWKENKRHGYGLFVNAEGEKSGGKWYNDSLILMTRRKNLKLPMVKKKIKQAVIDAVEASEKANKKTKLAITRGLAGRKLAEEAETVATVASGDAAKAQECRRKFTLHPLLEASLKNPSNDGSNLVSDENMQASKSTPNLSKRDTTPYRKTSSSSFSYTNNGHSVIRKKSSLLNPLAKNNDTSEMDLLHSFQNKHPASESALYAAMDTSIGAGALNPYLSQMVLMQYNDAQTRLSNMLTNGSEKTPSSALSTALVAAMAINTSNDFTDNSHKNSLASSESRRSSTASETSSDFNQKPDENPQKLSNTGSSPRTHKQTRALLHPSDCTKKRRSGVSNMALDADPSLAADEASAARLIQLKGRLLTGDEVNYNYVALNTSLEGKEAMILYTHHPKPKFRADVSISEKHAVNSSTGLYRTLVGDVPSVLNTTSPTGIPALDRHDSIDSGTANDDADLFIDSKGYVINRKLLNSTSKDGGGFKNNKTTLTPAAYANKGDLKVRYSFSPSFEERDLVNDVSEDERSPPHRQQIHKDLPSTDCKKVSTNTNTSKKNSVSVCQRTPSLSQVVINQQQSKCAADRIDAITSYDDNNDDKRRGSLEIGLTGQNGKSKHRFVSLLAKTWRARSNHSIRSTSTDSGYKQSMSIDDSTLNAHLSPKAGGDCAPIGRSANEFSQSKEINKNGDLVTGSTAVTIENNQLKNSKTSKRGSLKRSSLKKRLSTNGSEAANDETTFDQNKTIELSPLTERRINLPTFCDSFTERNCNDYVIPDDSVKQKYAKQIHPSSDDYVVLDVRQIRQKDVIDENTFTSPSNLTWV